MHLSVVTGRGGSEGFCHPPKKIAKMISGSLGAFLVFLVFPLFGGGSNPKAGGWILDILLEMTSFLRGARSNWSLLL